MDPLFTPSRWPAIIGERNKIFLHDTEKQAVQSNAATLRYAYRGHRLLLDSVVTRKSLWAVSYKKRDSSDCSTLLLLYAEVNRFRSRDRKGSVSVGIVETICMSKTSLAFIGSHCFPSVPEPRSPQDVCAVCWRSRAVQGHRKCLS